MIQSYLQSSGSLYPLLQFEVQIYAGAACSVVAVPYISKLANRVCDIFEFIVPNATELTNERINYNKTVMANIYRTVVRDPFYEEIAFRLFLEAIVAEGASALGIPLPYLTSALVSSITFGAAHYSNGYDKLALHQASYATFVGMGFSLLKYAFLIPEKITDHTTIGIVDALMKHMVGMPAAIAAHMTTNAIAFSRLMNEKQKTHKEPVIIL